MRHLSIFLVALGTLVPRVASAQAATQSLSAAAGSVTFIATDDGQVRLTSPSLNFGAKATTKLQRGKFLSYFKFTASGISGAVQSATLRLQVGDGAGDGGSSGGTLFSVSNNFQGSGTPWTEGSLTAGNAPLPGGTPVQTMGPVAPAAVVDFDVTSVVSGDGTYSFCLQDNTGDQVKYFTKEGATAPTLIVVTGPPPTNLPPVAVDDNGTTQANIAVSIDVAANDFDPDGTINPASVAIFSPPANGSAVAGANPGAVLYTPNSGFTGTDTFTYTIQDNLGAVSNTATVTVAVQNPTGTQTVVFTSTQDAQVKFTQPGTNYGTKQTMQIESGRFASYVKFAIAGVTGAVQNAKVRVFVGSNSTDGGPNGGSIFQVSNNFAGTSTPWVESTLTAVNGPSPTGSALSTAGAVAPGDTVEFDVTSAVSGNGEVSFRIDPNSADQVKYYTKEGPRPPALIVTYATGGGGNLPPVAVDDNAATPQATAVQIDVTANDFDPDGSINVATVSLTGPPANGSASADAAGMVTYTPNGTFTGTDTFQYKVQDNAGAFSNAATVTVTVNAPANIPPVAVDDNAATTQGANVVIDVTANDFDPDGSLNVGSVSLSLPANGSVSVDPVGLVTYSPIGAFTGTDTFQYSVQDNLGAVSNFATVTVAVSAGGGGGQPVAFVAQQDGQVKFTEPGLNFGSKSTMKIQNGRFRSYMKFVVSGIAGPVQSATLRVQVGNGPEDGGPNGGDLFQTSNNFPGTSTPWVESSLTASNAPAKIGGVLGSAGAVTPSQVVQFDVSTVVTGNGTYSFALNSSSSDIAKYFTKEGLTPPQLIVIPAGGLPNQPPVAVDDNATTTSPAPISIDVLANDFDPDGSLVPSSVTIFAVPTNGGASVNTTTGAILYTPLPGFFGVDSLKYTVQDDSSATSNVATVTVQVLKNNIRPVAVNDTVSTNEDVSFAIDVTANDFDPDGTLNISTVTIGTAPSNGSAVADPATGFVNYTPAANYFGQDNFTYTVQDNDGAVSNVATVYMTVISVNDPPVAVDDQAQSDGVSNLVIDILQNDSDIDGSIDPTTVSLIRLPSQGSAAVNPFSGVVTYTPAPNFAGDDTLTYTVDDNQGAPSNVAIVSISGAGTTSKFISIADAHVKSTEPGSNFGARFTMKVEVGRFLSYVKFNVSGVTGAIQSAKLRLFVVSAGSDGGSVYQVSNNYKGTTTPWDDAGLTFSNAPSITGNPLGSIGAVNIGDTVVVDVRQVVLGNGTYSFAIRNNGGAQVKYGTREGSNPPPELEIVTGGTPPGQGQLTVLSPNGGEVWTTASTQTVTWSSFGPTSNVKVEMSTDGGGSWATLLASTANDGSEAVQSGSVTSGNALIRISDASDGIPVDESDAPFSIVANLGVMDIVVDADDEYELYVNGTFVGSDNQWNIAQTYSAPLVSGKNVLAVKGLNPVGQGGAILEVRVNNNLVLSTDTAWRANLSQVAGWQTPGFDDSGWSGANNYGKYGVAPWNKGIINFPSTSKAHWIWSADSTDPVVYLRGSFFAGPPVVSSFTPSSAIVGSEITVTGQNYSTTIGGGSSGGTVRIMPLGDSITKGVTGSTDNAGYRNDLTALMDAAGIFYNMVGTAQNGTGFDNDHEGHNGYWADEILAEINTWLNLNPPDIILFHIGTNDISSKQSNSSTISEIGQNLDRIRAFDPNITTILAGIIPRKDSKNATTTQLVGMIKNLVTQRQQAGERVVYAPMNETFVANSNWQNVYYPSNDNIHPNDTGYNVMANVWFPLIQNIVGGGGTPTSTTVAFNGVPASNITVDSNTQLRVNVPGGATSGKITVGNIYGSGASATNFTVLSSTVAALDFFRGGPAVRKAGNAQALLWNTLGEVSDVRLDYSTDGGSTWQALSERQKNTGSFVWNSPADATGVVRVRVSDADGAGSIASETEITLVRNEARKAFPNAFELENALFAGSRIDRETLAFADLNVDSKVDLVDYVNLLDAGNAELRRLKSGEETGKETVASGDLRLTVPAVEAFSGSAFRIPVEIAGEQQIRGFQLSVTYDSSAVDLSEALPYENRFGMRLQARKQGDRLTIIGYLEKQDAAVAVEGTLLQLTGKADTDFEGPVDVQLSDVLFVSKKRLALTGAEIDNEAHAAAVPSDFSLQQNYPNPFNPSTQIKFSLAGKSRVQLNVYNIKGELVKTLINGELQPGLHKATWDGRNDRGLRVASGVYVYRIRAGKWKDSKMMTLVK